MHLAVGVLAPAAQHRHETALQRAAIAGISLERPTRSGPHLESGNRSCVECLGSCVEYLESGFLRQQLSTATKPRCNGLR